MSRGGNSSWGRQAGVVFYMADGDADFQFLFGLSILCCCLFVSLITAFFRIIYLMVIVLTILCIYCYYYVDSKINDVS